MSEKPFQSLHELPSGTVTFLFTDIEGSTKLAQQYPEGNLLLANIAMHRGNWDEARRNATLSVNIIRGLRDPLLTLAASNRLADIELLAGNTADAGPIYCSTLVAIRQMGQLAYVMHTLESFAYLARMQNLPERAARLLGAAEALRQGIGISERGIDRLESEYAGTARWLHELLEERAYRRAWDEGAAMNLDQAIAYGLDDQ